MKNNSPLNNSPLKIIALFCGLTEVAMATVLLNLDGDLQIYFMWFVMIFQMILLVFFFLTWNFNPKVLYSPSDFKNDKSYLDYMEIAYNLQNKLEAKIVAGDKTFTAEEIIEMLNEPPNDALEQFHFLTSILYTIDSKPEGVRLTEISNSCGESQQKTSKILTDYMAQAMVIVILVFPTKMHK